MRHFPLRMCGSLCFLVVSGSAALLAQCNPLEQAEVSPLVGFSADGFGAVLARSGNTLVVGAPAALTATVFERNLGPGAPWIETARLVGQAGFFGTSVAIDADTIVVGAPKDYSTGHMRIFGRDQGGVGNWGLVKKVLPTTPIPGDGFGTRVTIEGDTILVGAPLANNPVNGGEKFAGAVYVFERDEGGPDQWGEKQKIKPSNPLDWGQFGTGLKIVDGRVYIGEPGIHNSPYSGFARIYEHNGVKWKLEKTLSGSSPSGGDQFGFSLAAEGDDLVVGAPLKGAGKAYVFQRDLGGAGQWGEVIMLGLPKTGGAIGSSVSLSGNLLAVGAPERGLPFLSGRTALFGRDFDGVAWGLMSTLKGSTVGGKDHFGIAVELAGGELVVGVDDQNAPGSIYHYGGLVEYPYSYCAGGASGSSCYSPICGTGTPSATASSGFVVSTSFLEGNKAGLFYFGTNGQQAQPWGNGKSLQCVVGPVKRGPIIGGGGTNGVCDGSYSQDFNTLWTLAPSKNPGAGAVVQAQLWTRDPLSTSNKKTILSPALQFTVMP